MRVHSMVMANPCGRRGFWSGFGLSVRLVHDRCVLLPAVTRPAPGDSSIVSYLYEKGGREQDYPQRVPRNADRGKQGAGVWCLTLMIGWPSSLVGVSQWAGAIPGQVALT